MAEFDPRPRPIADPQQGFWLVRRGQGYPWCPAAILRLCTRHEPGEPSNLMDRSPFLAAFISSQPVALSDVWERRGRVISRAEYERQLRDMQANERANRYDPRLSPDAPVKLSAMPIPFARTAE